jgi:hypothetical protein
MFRALVASLVLASALAGCGAVSNPNVPPPAYSCEDIPSGACQEQADGLLAAVRQPVRSIEMVCAGQNCTRAGGAGTATITLVDNTTVRRDWSYVGDPNPAPNPVCFGLAHDVCVERLREVIDGVSPSHHLTTVTVTCTQRCNAAQGDVAIVFTSEGGLQETIGTSWGQAQP